MDTDKQDPDETIKKRSALTPTADNEHGVVTVPYASMALHGRMTTYCYSGNYYVAERGLNDPLGKGVFTKDFEPKLNGRDDYGLLFYTLIGTSRNEGYLIFLAADGPGKKLEEPAPVEAFESHAFVPLEGDTPVMVHRNAAKSVKNRLGYIHSEVPFTVQHPEHEDIEQLDAGWWEVRRCKSYENNPVAVWSLTID